MNQQKLPNATAVLVLGIVSIIGCCCYGVVGIITGIVGLYLFKKDNALYKQNPDLYSDYSNLNTGKILCIIGIILSVLYIGYLIVVISTLGLDAMKDPQLMQERLKELMGQ
ncbi:CCC motif membrane protein [Chryseobacterium polytrichastri]|uniref:M penetrans paralogue family 26 n=1 Tax=Chryseobacterium polytrichastri TaxID=1302687 RepID=A0A1M7JBN2_9FLAO|nr:CCC motif membrane protein [Chryseobacterium polytrichastri]SHM50384.1 M penetrans paralogue family 26 [Chryseobacterium polytrichastri]